MEFNTILKFNADSDTLLNSQPELNTIETVITPDKPKVLANEQIEMYVPKADYGVAGIASFDSEGFTIDADGKVKLRRTSLRNVKDFIVDVETGICTIYYDDGTVSNISFPVSTDKIYKRNELLTYIELTPDSFIKDHNTGQWFAILPYTLTGFTDSKFMVSFEVKTDALDVEGITQISNQGYITVMDSVYKGNDGSLLVFIDTDFDRYNFYGRLLLLGGSVFVDEQIVSMNYNTTTGMFNFIKTDGGYYEFNLLPMSAMTETLIELDNKVDDLEAARVNVYPEDWECIYEDGMRETKTVALIDKLGVMFKSTDSGTGQAKEIVTVDIYDMLMSQNTYLYLDLTKRFYQGEILILCNLYGISALVEAVAYDEDYDGNPLTASWVLTTSEWSNDVNLQDVSSTVLSVHMFSYKNGSIEYGYSNYDLYNDFVREEALSNTLDDAKKYTLDVFAETKQYIDNEIATFDFIKVVDELPETGLPNREYFVRKTNSTDDNDLFDEWAWINRGTETEPDWDWEFKGTKKIEIDLSDYVKNTDIASPSKAGVVFGDKAFGFNISERGIPQADVLRAEEYGGKSVATFIGKGTLENIKYDYIRRGLVDNTSQWGEGEQSKALDWLGAAPNKLAGRLTPGLIAAGEELYYGFCVSTFGIPYAYEFTLSDYLDDGKVYPASFISKQTLENIKYDLVKRSLVDNDTSLSDDERIKVCNWLGARHWNSSLDIDGDNGISELKDGYIYVCDYNSGNSLVISADEFEFYNADSDDMIYLSAPKEGGVIATEEYVDDGFVAKTIEQPNNYLVYGRTDEANGFKQRMYGTAYNPSWGGLVLWGSYDTTGATEPTSDGSIPFRTPKQPYQPATKKYVDDNFAPKTTIYPDYEVIFGRKNVANNFEPKEFTASKHASDGCLVMGSAYASSGQTEPVSGGTLVCKEPINPYQIANKKYVDDRTKFYLHTITGVNLDDTTDTKNHALTFICKEANPYLIPNENFGGYEVFERFPTLSFDRLFDGQILMSFSMYSPNVSGITYMTTTGEIKNITFSTSNYTIEEL